MEIRRAETEDAEQIEQIHVDAYQTNYRGYIPDKFLDNFTLTSERIARTKMSLDKAEFWIAADSSKIFGFAVLNFSDTDTFEIKALYIAPQHQKQGIGSLLVNTLCHDKKKLGFKKCVVWTLKSGPSLGFYEKCGSSKTSSEKLWKYDLPIVMFEKFL